MSNYYLHYLLSKRLDVTTSPEKPDKRFVPRYIYPILNEGEDDDKKIDIQPHHVEWFNGVMTQKKKQFFKVFKVPGKTCITTVSEKKCSKKN